KGPSGRISVADKQTFDESTLTPDIVMSKIQSAYMAGLKRCYREFLKKDASARGKVTLSLTINETGRTTKGSAKGFASEVDDCISALMAGWRFPIPKDKDGEATEASFAITLQLVPD
ncbi:MAG TPA: AgmX/PglI C-terminal domain-containing protein, partial [Kofleriaceae bacterium]